MSAIGGARRSKMTLAKQRQGENEAHLRALVEAAPIPMVISRASDGSILQGNAHLAETFALPYEDMAGRSTLDFYVNPADRAALLELLERDGHVGSQELQVKEADGTPFWVIASVQLVEMGGEPALIAGFYNVSERKRAEEALRESEAKFRALTETSGVPTWVVQGRRFVYVNPAMEDALGYTRAEFQAMDFWDAVHPDDMEMVREAGLARQRGEEAPSRYEVRCKTKSGEDRWLDVTAASIEFEGRHAVVGMALDITERRQAEAALGESEARNRALLELVPDMMFRLSADCVYLDFIPGKRLEPLMPPDQFLGKRVFDVLPKALAEEFARLVREALDSGEVQALEYALSVDEKRHYFESRIVAISQDEVLTIVRDVTRRKQAEGALRDSEERYRALYEDNPSMYFTVDGEGTVLSVNGFGAEQLGYAVDELVGRSISTVLYEDDRKAVLRQLKRCARNPGQVAEWEYRKLRKDGSLMWVKEIARAVRGPSGEPMVLIVCEDITKRVQAEEALQEAREELESRVESRMEVGNAYELTFRELTVLYLAAGGKADKEIAAVLGISPRTVGKHLENILAKMGASSRTEAGVRAVREGLLG